MLVYWNRDNDVKRFKYRRCYLPKGIIKYYNVIINGKNFYDQPIDSDINDIRKEVILQQGKFMNYTTGCLVDYEYIKNHYKLLAVNLNRQKKKKFCSKSNLANRIYWTIKKY